MNLLNLPPYQKSRKKPKRRSQAEIADEAFRSWLQTQPSCICGTFGEYLESGDGRNVAAHVRRARNAGTAYKPLFSAVPLTQAQHLLQHQHGEEYFRPKAWWDEQARLYFARWEEFLNRRGFA